MVLVIRVRPRQIERFVFISIILLLIATNVFFFTQWVPKDKAAVALVQELPVVQDTQQATAEGSTAEGAEGYEVLDLEELEQEVKEEEKEEEPAEEEVEEPEEKEEEPEPVKEEPKEEKDDGTLKTGKVKFYIDDLDWSVDGDSVRLERIYYTIENGLSDSLDNPRFHVYIYDQNDDDFLKSNAAGKFSIGKNVVTGDEFAFVIKAGEVITNSIQVYDETSKQNLLYTLDDADLQKTIKVYLKDSGTDTDEFVTVKETAK